MAEWFRRARRALRGGVGSASVASVDSEYRPVADSEVTPRAVEVWLELPKEIRADPAFESFHQLHERQTGQHSNSSPKIPEKDSPPLTIETSNRNLSNNLGQDGHLSETEDNENNALFDKDQKQGFSTASAKSGVSPRDQAPRESDNKNVNKWKTALYYVKISSLVVCWTFIASCLVLTDEKKEVFYKTFLEPHDFKEYKLSNSTSGDTRVMIKLRGPFSQEDEPSNSSSVLKVWLQRTWRVDEKNHTNYSGVDLNSSVWSILLLRDESLDFSTAEERVIVLPPDNDSLLNGNYVSSANRYQYSLWLSSNASSTLPLSLGYQLNPLDPKVGVIYAAVLLSALYVLIIFEVVNRTFAAMLTSSMALAVLSILGERPSTAELFSWLDTETLLLLFSMMLLVAVLAETGVFDYLAVYAFKVTNGRIWPLFTCLCVFTAVVSSFLDNVTTVLLMTPVTIRLCEVMGLNPVPVLMSMVLYSNVGGTATPVGDPPNVIIASNIHVQRAGINFAEFTMHMGLGILFVSVQVYLQLRYKFRDLSKLKHDTPPEIREIRQELKVWKRAAASISGYSKDEALVRDTMLKKTHQLNAQLKTAKKNVRKPDNVTEETFRETLQQMEQKYPIRDRVLLVKAGVAVGFVVVVFFLHVFPQFQRITLGWTALLGAILLLALADHEDLEPVLARVEWSTLLFFAALFVLMEALSKLGLIVFIGSLTERLILAVDEEARLAVAILLILWVSAVTSAFVDNIPLTTMMIRVATSLGDNAALGLPLRPLVWALSFGACLGGNATLIGASANVVCAGVAEQHGYRFTFGGFFKLGCPVTIGSIATVSVYLLIAHCVFQWH